VTDFVTESVTKYMIEFVTYSVTDSVTKSVTDFVTDFKNILKISEYSFYYKNIIILIFIIPIIIYTIFSYNFIIFIIYH